MVAELAGLLLKGGDGCRFGDCKWIDVRYVYVCVREVSDWEWNGGLG